MAHDAKYWTDVEELFNAVVDLSQPNKAVPQRLGRR